MLRPHALYCFFQFLPGRQVEWLSLLQHACTDHPFVHKGEAPLTPSQSAMTLAALAGIVVTMQPELLHGCYSCIATECRMRPEKAQVHAVEQSDIHTHARANPQNIANR